MIIWDWNACIDNKGIEFKWGKKEKVRFFQTFTDNYQASETYIISPDNMEDFLLEV